MVYATDETGSAITANAKPMNSNTRATRWGAFATGASDMAASARIARRRPVFPAHRT
jgi:hypothetical protein